MAYAGLLGDLGRDLSHDFEMTHVRSSNRQDSHPHVYTASPYVYGGGCGAAVAPAYVAAPYGGCGAAVAPAYVAAPYGGCGAAVAASPYVASPYMASPYVASPYAGFAAAYPGIYGDLRYLYNNYYPGRRGSTVPMAHGTAPLTVNSSVYGTSIVDATGMSPVFRW